MRRVAMMAGLFVLGVVTAFFVGLVAAADLEGDW